LNYVKEGRNKTWESNNMYWIKRINMRMINIRYRMCEVYKNRSKDWTKLDLSRMQYRRYMWIINFVLQKDLI